MHFVVIGMFKPDAQDHAGRWSREWNEHLAGRPIRIAGPLLNEAGKQQGWMAILDAESRQAAQAFLDRSPYFQAHLYERVGVYDYPIEVGRLD